MPRTVPSGVVVHGSSRDVRGRSIAHLRPAVTLLRASSPNDHHAWGQEASSTAFLVSPRPGKCFYDLRSHEAASRVGPVQSQDPGPQCHRAVRARTMQGRIERDMPYSAKEGPKGAIWSSRCPSRAAGERVASILIRPTNEGSAAWEPSRQVGCGGEGPGAR